MNPHTFRPVGNVFADVYKTMLEKHPLAFDCLVFPAKSSLYDEIIADNAPEDRSSLLNRDERAQSYDPPIEARAMIIPDDSPLFGVTESGSYESFHTAQEDIKLLVSVEGLQLYSLIQWNEYLAIDKQDIVSRTVYVTDIKPVGRTLGAKMIYLCRPLLAEGEIPEQGNPQNEPEEPGVV